MKRKLLILIYLMGGWLQLSSQDVNVDSLHAVALEMEDGVERIKIFHDLFLEVEYIDTLKAHYYVDESIRIAEKIGDSSLLGTSYRYKGWLQEDCGDIIGSLKSHQKSTRIFELLGDKQNIADCYGNLGNTYENLGNNTKGLEYQHKSLTLNEEILLASKDSNEISRAREGKSYAISNLGGIYIRLGEFDKALEFQLRSLEMEKQANNLYGLAVSYSTLGILNHKLNNYEKSKYYLNESLAISKEIDNYSSVTVCYLSLSVVAEKEKDFPLAFLYLDSAEIYGLMVNDRYTLATIACNRANINLRLNNVDEAEKIALEAKKIGEEIQSLEKSIFVYNLLSDIYNRKGRYDLALQYYKKYIVYKDSIFDKQNKQELIRKDLELEFAGERVKDSIRNAEIQNIKDLEIETKNSEIAKQEALLDKEKTMKLALYGGLGFVLFIVLILYRGMLRKKKDHQIIIEQKKEVEQQRDLAHRQKIVAEEQTHLVEEKNKEITDSISYAKRIQAAILPANHQVKKYLKESFVLYKPKDIVAGDFYWMEVVSSSSPDNVGRVSRTEQPDTFGITRLPAGTAREDRTVLFAVADCTGHGVPGAMVSVVCHNALNRSVREYNLKNPGEILDKTTDLVIEQFDKSEEEVKDGMDIALCSLELVVPGSMVLSSSGSENISSEELRTHNSESRTVAKLQYAGAHNPLWIIRSVNSSSDKGVSGDEQDVTKSQYQQDIEKTASQFEIIEIKATKQPIGKFDKRIPFEEHTVQLQANDSVYIFSDGFVDQFGGPRGKKFKSQTFKTLLLSIQHETMEEQCKSINQAFEEWKGDLEQIDDVCVIGVRV